MPTDDLICKAETTAKVKVDPTASMRSLAIYMKVSILTMWNVIHLDLGLKFEVYNPSHLLTASMKESRHIRSRIEVGLPEAQPFHLENSIDEVLHTFQTKHL